MKSGTEIQLGPMIYRCRRGHLNVVAYDHARSTQSANTGRAFYVWQMRLRGLGPPWENEVIVPQFSEDGKRWTSKVPNAKLNMGSCGFKDTERGEPNRGCMETFDKKYPLPVVQARAVASAFLLGGEAAALELVRVKWRTVFGVLWAPTTTGVGMPR